MGAAHCFDDIQATGQQQAFKLRSHTFRDDTVYEEQIELKRHFKHPLYKYPTLYNDIAIAELGRRIEYNYDRYGDTPTCLDQGKYENIDKTSKFTVCFYFFICKSFSLCWIGETLGTELPCVVTRAMDTLRPAPLEMRQLPWAL